MRSMCFLFCMGLVGTVFLDVVAGEVWPRFRGPGGSGVAVGSDMPVVFGEGTNLVWKREMSAGHSSPCIWGERLVLTGSEGDRLMTICVRRRDGVEQWRRVIEPGRVERLSGNSSAAASTAASDGERFYVYFGSFGLISYDGEGVEVWRRPLPVPVTQHGASSSPVVAGNCVVMLCDQDVGSYLLAVDGRTGATLWRTERAGYRRGYSSPLLWPEEKPELAIVAGTLRVAAYALESGREEWSASGLPNEMVSSPVAGCGLIFAAGWTHGSGVSRLPTFDWLLEQGDSDHDKELTRDEAPVGPAKQHFFYIDADKDGRMSREEWETMAEIFSRSQNACLAIRPGGRGDVTKTHVIWRGTRGLPYVPSPLVYEGRLYLVKNGGLLSCYDARTGAVKFQEERLGALGEYYASPVAAGGKVLLVSERGVAVVVRAGDNFEVLARNALGEGVLATPAVVGGTIYMRTKGHLYAFCGRSASDEGSVRND